MPSDITQMDLYQLFDVLETATTKEITSAYRQKALTCHPDKFPGDKEKHELFLLIKDALAILTDEKARKEHDQVRKQKQVQKERLSQMDDKRKKFKEDLERNERNANQPKSPMNMAANSKRLEAEIARLRREGSHLVDEELEKLNTVVREERQRQCSNPSKIVIKFSPDSASYTDDELREIFQKYGPISTIVNMSHVQQALIEFQKEHLSQIIESEKGTHTKPFRSVKIKKQNKTKTSTAESVIEQVDLTKPELEDLEAMVFKKMAQAMNS